MGKRKVHFSCGRGHVPACGDVNWGDKSIRTEIVTCLRCRRTKAYREAVKAAEEAEILIEPGKEEEEGR